MRTGDSILTAAQQKPPALAESPRCSMLILDPFAATTMEQRTAYRTIVEVRLDRPLLHSVVLIDNSFHRLWHVAICTTVETTDHEDALALIPAFARRVGQIDTNTLGCGCEFTAIYMEDLNG